MSFSKDVKKEVLNNGFEGNQRALAFLCGLVYSSAEYEVVGNQIKNFVIPTDVDFLVDGVNLACKILYSEVEGARRSVGF